MDTFFEQIISVRKTGKALFAVVGIWLLALILSAALILIGTPYLGTLSFLLVCGVIFGAYKLSTLFNIEYEYIITNGTMDIDKIINRSSRKRILSFELANVTRIEKYNPAQLNSINQKSVTFACDANDPEAYFMVAEREGKGSVYLIFSPEERLRTAIVKFVPKYIANSAFK